LKFCVAGNALPRTFERGELKTIRYDHWVSGF